MKYIEKTYNDLLNEENKLLKKYEEIEDSCARRGLTFEQFCEEAKETREKIYLIGKYKRKKQDPIVEYGKEWNGSLIEFNRFVEMCKNGELEDSDGRGYYATETSKSDVVIIPSDVIENITRDDFSHVIWFNK